MEDRYELPSTIGIIQKRFQEFGFPYNVNKNVISNDDNSTLFICSGMQPLKNKFKILDKSHYGSLQSCIRTNDLELVGDGSHLTYFEMVGNFSFGCNDYNISIEMWHRILKDLNINIDCIHIHPDSDKFHSIWKKLGYETINDSECKWSDGDIGGYCCEVYSRGIEIGNLVNPMEHSTDVGFGLERLCMITENKERIDQTSLFDTNSHPIVADHGRTLSILWQNNIEPGNKGRNYVCRRLIRRMLNYINNEKFIFQKWIESEKELLSKRMPLVKKMWKKYKDKPSDFWWQTYGIHLEDVGKFN